MLIINMLVAAVSAVILFGCEQPETKEYSRIKGENFQVASKSFVNKDGNGPVITLLGTSYFGEEDHYKQLQNILDDADVVLYEEVISAKEESLIRTAIKTKCPRHKALIRSSLSLDNIAKMLDLKEPRTAINFERSNFIHADYTAGKISFSELANSNLVCKYLDEHGAELTNQTKEADSVTDTISALGSEASRNALALALTKFIVSEREDAHRLEKTAIFDRNDLVMKALDEKLPTMADGKKVIIIYSTLHLADLERSIRAKGYELSSTEWLSAFKL